MAFSGKRGDGATENISTRNTALLLGLIVILAAALRLYGLEWGLPNAVHPHFSRHPDETFHLTWAEWLFQGIIIPKHFMYGGTFYFNYLHAVNLLAGIFAPISGDPSLLYCSILLGRLFNVLFSLITVFLTWKTGATLYNGSTGLAGALLTAVFPGHLIFAQYLRPEELFLLLLTAGLFVAALTVKGNRHPATAVTAGVISGVCVSLRIPGLALFPVFLAAYGLSGTPDREPGLKGLAGDKRIWITASVALLAFVAAGPQILIHFPSFIEGMKLLLSYQSSPLADTVGHGPVWFQYARRILGAAMTDPFHLAVFPAIGLALYRRSSGDILLLLFIASYFLFLSGSSWATLRFAAPLLPPLALLVARGGVDLYRCAGRLKIPLAGCLCACLLSVLLADAAWDISLTQPDPRDVATLDILNTIPEGARIGTFIEYEGDCFFIPVSASIHQWSYCNLNGDDVEQFLTQTPDYLVLSGDIMIDVMRLEGKQIDKNRAELYRWMKTQRNYKPVAVFQRNIRLFGIDFSSYFTTSDYLAAQPSLFILKKE